MKRIIAGFCVSLMITLGLPLEALAASNVTVTSTNPQGWSRTGDSTTGGAVKYVYDTTSGTTGVGAVELTTDSTTSAKAVYGHATNTPLSSITSLSYNTKQNAPSGTVADPAYQLVTCLTGAPTATSCPGYTTLTYDPYQGAQGTVANGVWQSWDISNGGLFYSSRAVTCSNGSVAKGSGGPAIYTLAQLQTACPSAVVAEYQLDIGSNNPSYNVEADEYNFNGTTYDFEPDSAPTHRSQCKDNGYQAVTDPATNAPFTSQADCISYVNANNYRIAGDLHYDAYGLERHAILYMNTAKDGGTFKYSDANGDKYEVKVSDVSVRGQYGYFAGEVKDASNSSWNGLWLFGEAYGSNADHQQDLIWGSFTDKATAENGVANMTSPADGPFSLMHGYLNVKKVADDTTTD